MEEEKDTDEEEGILLSRGEGGLRTGRMADITALGGNSYRVFRSANSIGNAIRMTKVIFGRDAPWADPAIRKMKLRGASSVKFIPLRSIIRIPVHYHCVYRRGTASFDRNCQSRDEILAVFVVYGFLRNRDLSFVGG